MAIGIVVGAAAVPEIRVKHPGHWDALGAAMTLGGMVGVMWGIKHIAAVMAVDAAGAAALVIGFALLAAFVRRCLRSEHPLIEVSLFRSKPFTAGMLCAVGLVFAMASLTFLMSQWFQLVGGSSPLEAGLLLAPMAAISVFAGFGGVPLALKMGARAVIAGGLFAAALGMVSMILSIGNVSTGSIVFASCLVGLGTGAFAVASSVIACATPVEKASSAAALEETAYDFGNVLGISTLGSLVSVIYRLGLDPAVLANAGLDAGSFAESMESYGAAVDIAQSTGVAELVIEGAAAYSDGIAIACFVGGMIMIVASIVIWKLVPKSLNITEEEA